MHALPPLLQRLRSGEALHRHRHDAAYVAVVLAGRYEEAGDQGRRRLAAGDAVVHAAFSGHANAVSAQGARVLNLPLAVVDGGFGRIDDPDALACLARSDALAAAELLRTTLRPVAAELRDWPDLLARALMDDPRLELSAWASRQGLAPETLSRGFARAFGTTPKRFRADLRCMRALRSATELPLAAAALDAGFADQAHMTHAVKALTGRSPGQWRSKSSADKTGA